MMADNVCTYEGKRVLLSTKKTFQDVVDTLRRQTNPHGKAESIPPKPPKPHSQMTKSEFVAHWESLAGVSGFAYLAEFDYGDWIRLFDVGEGITLKRFIVGNPLIAITMLEHDLNASLFVPVELLIRQAEGGNGTEIRYNLPSSQMLVGSSKDNVGLRRAAEHLDAKLEALVRTISADIPLVQGTVDR